MALDPIAIVVDSSPAMLAYWDRDERCLFANAAYMRWFGHSPESLIGTTLRELLGPSIYAANRPYIEAALRGERQEFEREIPDPAGGPPRHSHATYVPHIENSEVLGFCVHVSEITQLRNALTQIKALQGLIPVCAWCRKIRDDNGYWMSLERYLAVDGSQDPIRNDGGVDRLEGHVIPGGLNMRAVVRTPKLDRRSAPG